MRQVFADTGYWIAVFFPCDEFHSLAKTLDISLKQQNVIIVTSEFVLNEFLAFFSRFNTKVRQQVANFVLQIQDHPDININPSPSDLFYRAVTLYRTREDKQWSLTDCHSFLIMQDLGIPEALAHDKHFEQAGFKILLKR
ncbi:MAG: PIN domain-containing protein [Oscillatoria sp. PMC 1068.18]|nr:PIN domain-containing protein [Oscillatoria sp. PMC 1076.18]MEC4988630.1 PIN domain-containing protein [Oscillatoria sp. PMC 1068.18]